jgi:8-oxo-dGTP diphosphatase
MATLKTAALEKSSHLEYFNIAVSVDCVILGYADKALKVLLIKSIWKNLPVCTRCSATW